jgi:CubicO group peptidase (beta-lactamase class C family)
LELAWRKTSPLAASVRLILVFSVFPVGDVPDQLPSAVEPARRVVLDAIERRTFPGAAVDVGSSDGSLWHEGFGRPAFASALPPPLPSPSPSESVSRSGPLPAPALLHAVESAPFDLASLTKVIATTTVIMELVTTGVVRLGDRIAGFFPEWRGADRETVTVQDLLEHASGLPARLLDRPPSTRRELEHDICSMPLAYAPRSQSLYSDLGFILLGMLAESRGSPALDGQFNAIRARLRVVEPALGEEQLTFKLSGPAMAHAAPTLPEDDDVRRGRMLAGDVHDSYAALLGGVAGHAGLFGTAAGVAAFARLVLRAARGRSVPAPLSPSLVATFTAKSAVAGSSRALGWDTMLPSSSCGTRMSPAAIGHVGFTGTSLWLDPNRDRYFVLLTNRSCRGGTLAEMRTVRRSFHDALGEF